MSPIKSIQQARIALVYDRVNTPYGGAERVLLAVHTLFPKAPLYTSVYSKEQTKWADAFQVIPSFLQKIPWASRMHRWLLPLMPIAYEQLDLSDFDIIISISSAEAKGVITTPNQLHICYLLTPTRYLYSHRSEYLASCSFFIRPVIRTIFSYITWWDQVAVHRPDFIIPISKRVADRIATYYPNIKCEEPIYPPIARNLIRDTSSIHSNIDTPFQSNTPNVHQKSAPYLLSYGRLVPYKRFDMVIDVAIAQKKKLIIIGEGPDLPRLKARAKDSRQIIFKNHVSQKDLREFIQNAQAVVFPAEEDFGISQVEVALQGTPVILHKKSGAAEIIGSYPHVISIDATTHQQLISAIMTLDTINANATIDSKDLTKYDSYHFTKKFGNRIQTIWKEWQKQKIQNKY